MEDRLLQEEGQGRAAQGCGFLLTAEAVDRRVVQGMAIGGLGLIRAYVRGRQLMSQHFSLRTAMITETRKRSGRAIQAQALRQVLDMGAQGRVRVSSTSHAIHHLLLTLLAQRSAMIQAESLRRRMCCAAARWHLTQLTSVEESPPMTATEQAQISEYTVPISGTPQVLHLLRPLKRTRSIYDMEEQPLTHLRRPRLTPSDGRERGRRPLKRNRSIYDMEEQNAAPLHRPGLTPSDGRER